MYYISIFSHMSILYLCSSVLVKTKTLLIRFSGVWICWWRVGAQAMCHPYSYCCKAPVQSSRQHNPKGYLRITLHSTHVQLKHEFGTILTGYYNSKWTPVTIDCVGPSMIRLWPTNVLGRLVHILEFKSTVAMLPNDQTILNIDFDI